MGSWAPLEQKLGDPGSCPLDADSPARRRTARSGVSPVSSQLRRFIREYIDSVSTLEVLLAIRAGGDTGRTVGELTRELTSSTHSVETRLDALWKSGLLLAVEGDRFVVAGLHPSERACLDELAGDWPRRRVAITEAIFSGL